jgi:uncharacterized protein
VCRLCRGCWPGLTGLPWATLVLGTSPGGIAEMAITAKVLQLGVPVVTAFQVCRLVAVLVLAEPVYRWFRPAGVGLSGGGPQCMTTGICARQA